MRHLGGQAVRHLFGGILAILGAVGAALVAGAWWLNAHPVPVPWLAQRIQMAADRNLGPGVLSIGAAAIGWDGFRAGQGEPIAIRLQNVRVRLPDARRAEATEIDVQLNLLPLLHGTLRPRSARIEGAHLVLARSGGESLVSLLTSPARGGVAARSGVSSPVAAFEENLLNGQFLPQAPPWAGSLRSLAVQDAEISVDGAAAPFLSGLNASLDRGGDGDLHLSARFALSPSSLAKLSPDLGQAARLDAAVSVRADALFDERGRPLSGEALIKAGSGRLSLTSEAVPLLGGTLSAAWSQAGGLAGVLNVRLRAGDGAAPTRFLADASARVASQRGSENRIAVQGTARFDSLPLADLARLWPSDLAPDARDWLTGNVTGGTASGLDLKFAGSTRADGADPMLDSVSGMLSGSDLTVHWLRPVPPVEHAAARVNIIGPDRIEIDVSGGEEMVETGPAPEALRLGAGRIVISGLSAKTQLAEVHETITGSVPSALGLLSNPRLHLLSDHPVPLTNPRGELVAEVGAVLPLLQNVTMDQVQISTAARLAHAGLEDLIAGRPLTDADINLHANGDGLSFAGIGAIASIPARFTGTMDFRAGPAGQVLQRIEVQGTTDLNHLAALGIDTGDLLAGPADLSALYVQRRGDDATLAVKAGLQAAVMRLDVLGWRKQAGEPASLSGVLVLDHAGRLVRIDQIEGSGVGFGVLGSARLDPSGAATILLRRVTLGATRAQGTIALARGGRDVRVDVSGPMIDLGPRLRASPGERGANGQTDAGAWWVEARFDRVLLAHGRAAGNLVLHAEGRGERVHELALGAVTAGGAAVQARITPDRLGRKVALTAADGGTLLRDLGVVGDVEGGRLKITGRFDDRRSDHPLTGRIEMDDFRLRGTPVLGKVLQAASFYGLVQALDGPGMGFAHLEAPFAYANDVITIDRARAFNPSLGLTARGSVDLGSDRLKIDGTIVPAYYLNTALGRLPLIGRLFSPEAGGGLIAAQYAASGSLDDPAVSVNPLSALAPGFLRGLFGARPDPRG